MTHALLTEKQQAFADAWAGHGSGARAAALAGFGGTRQQLRSVASRLLRHEGVRTRILARLGPKAFDRPEHDGREGRGVMKPDLDPAADVGTTTERVELLMEMARDESLEPKDRVAAVKLAALICGEIGPVRYAPPPPAKPRDPSEPTEPIGPSRPLVRLVTSKADAALRGDDDDEPTKH